jgi:hypothetical protein
MKMAWQTETGHLTCRWSGAGERIEYRPRWMQEASRDIRGENVPQPVPLFTRLSPFGRAWFAVSRSTPS